jgi:hypothetical protein
MRKPNRDTEKMLLHTPNNITQSIRNTFTSFDGVLSQINS